MPTSRTLMFLLLSGSPTGDALNFSGLELGKTLEESFELALLGKGLNEQQMPSDYSFYDWELNQIPAEMKVRDIPSPGIVLSIKKGLSDRPEVLAGKAKYHLTWFESNILDSFLSDPSTQFQPSTLGDVVSDAIEVKPGICGFSVDLKKFFRALFNRRRSER